MSQGRRGHASSQKHLGAFRRPVAAYNDFLFEVLFNVFPWIVIVYTFQKAGNLLGFGARVLDRSKTRFDLLERARVCKQFLAFCTLATSFLSLLWGENHDLIRLGYSLKVAVVELGFPSS